MPILTLIYDSPASSGTTPRKVMIESDDTKSVLKTIGYLNKYAKYFSYTPVLSDVIYASCSDSNFIGLIEITNGQYTIYDSSYTINLPVLNGRFAFFQQIDPVEIGNDGISPSDSSKKSVVMFDPRFSAVTGASIPSFANANGAVLAQYQKSCGPTSLRRPNQPNFVPVGTGNVPVFYNTVGSVTDNNYSPSHLNVNGINPVAMIDPSSTPIAGYFVKFSDQYGTLIGTNTPPIQSIFFATVLTVQNVPVNTTTPIVFTNVVISNPNVSLSNGIFTFNTPGYYRIRAQIGIAPAVGGPSPNPRFSFVVGGVTVGMSAGWINANQSTGPYTVGGTTSLMCVAYISAGQTAVLNCVNTVPQVNINPLINMPGTTITIILTN